MARARLSEIEKAKTEASDRFMDKPVLMEELHRLAKQYEKLFPIDVGFGLHAIRDTIGVLVAERMEKTATDREGEIARLREQLAKGDA